MFSITQKKKDFSKNPKSFKNLEIKKVFSFDEICRVKGKKVGKLEILRKWS